MAREALPNMAPILQENALPRRKLLGIRPSEMDRHQTEPVPRDAGPHGNAAGADAPAQRKRSGRVRTPRHAFLVSPVYGALSRGPRRPGAAPPRRAGLAFSGGGTS